MSKRRLTHVQQLQKEATPDSPLSRELEAVRIALEKPKSQAISELIKLLKSSKQRETQWLIARVLSTAKDERVISPLLKAALAPENITHRSNFLWPLENYYCSKYAGQLVKLLLSRPDYDEVVWACVEIIRVIKGLIEPSIARRLVRQLLAEVNAELTPDDLTALHAFRLEAADKIMALYFNHTLCTFWKKWNNGEWPTSEASNPA